MTTAEIERAGVAAAASGVVWGCIAPHGDIAVPEACEPGGGALATQRAMAELGRRCLAARPDAVVVATPHNVHVGGAMAVLTSRTLHGVLDDAAVRVELRCPVDRELAWAVHAALRDAGIPCVTVSYGGNDPNESENPLDWGALVPLWHLGARAEPPLPAVVVSPCRELDAEAHVAAGRAIATAARTLSRRIAFVGSADQGHGHSADGPYGYHAESAEFDALVAQLVREQRLDDLAAIPVDDVRAAVADSWWQMLMLAGAVGPGSRCELLSYEAPTYYGMLCAEVLPAAAGD